MATTGFALTPHKLSMCVLLQAFALPSSASPSLPHLSAHSRHKFSLFVLQMLKAHDDFLEPSFQELGLQLKLAFEDGGILVHHVASRLLGFLSPEDLCTFALGLRELLTTGMNDAREATLNKEEPLLIDSSSILGHFLRRCLLAFNLLSFEGTCKLLTDLDVYRQPMLISQGQDHTLQSFFLKSLNQVSTCDEDWRNDDEQDYLEHERDDLMNVQEQEKEDNLLKAFPDFSRSPTQHKVQNPKEGLFLRTNDQVDSLTRELADIIEREVGLFTPDEVEFKLNQLEKLAPDFFKVHYLRYLHFLLNGDYPAALDSLHRYSDYSTGKGDPNNTVNAGALTGRSQAELLALGSMHARFGHTGQALQSLYEAVGIAQQSNDDVCLAHALAALCHLISEIGDPSDACMAETSLLGWNVGNGPSLTVQEQLLLLLNCCLRRALELRLLHLIAFGHLVLAKFNLKFAQRPLSNVPRTSEQLLTSPLGVYKTLRLSPFLLNVITVSSVPVASLAAGGRSILSASSQHLSLHGSHHYADMRRSLSISRTHPVLGSILQLAGSSHLLRATSWELYGSAPMTRISTLIHGICYMDVANADDLSLAYVKLVRHLAAHRGYKEAFMALDIATKKFPLTAKPRLRVARLQLIQERALHRGDIKTAQTACDMLSALFSPVQGVDVELKIDVRRRQAQIHLRAGQFAEAASVAHSLFNICYKYKMQLESIVTLLLIAEIHKKAGSFVSGLPFALASVTLSKSLNLDLVHALAIVTLAELWLGLGPSHAHQALALLQQCMPLVLGHGGRELRARTYLTLARCHLCDPTYSVHTNPQAVVEPLQEAAEEFETLEDNEQSSEVFYLQARVFHALGAVEERNRAAALFQKFTLALQVAQNMETDNLLQ